MANSGSQEWTKEDEGALNELVDDGTMLYTAHTFYAYRNQRLYRIFATVSVSLTTLVTILLLLPSEAQGVWLSWACVMLNAIGSLVNWYSSARGFNKLAEKHRAVAAEYGDIETKVRTQLALPTERRIDPRDLLQEAQARYHALFHQTTEMPNDIAAFVQDARRRRSQIDNPLPQHVVAVGELPDVVELRRQLRVCRAHTPMPATIPK